MLENKERKMRSTEDIIKSYYKVLFDLENEEKERLIIHRNKILNKWFFFKWLHTEELEQTDKMIDFIDKIQMERNDSCKEDIKAIEKLLDKENLK